ISAGGALYDPRPSQSGDFFWGIAQFAEDGVAVGADFWGGAAQLTRRLDKLDRKAEHADRAVTGVLLGDDHLLFDNLRIGEDLRKAHDAAARHPGAVEPLDPLFGRAAGEVRLDCGVDRAA